MKKVKLLFVALGLFVFLGNMSSAVAQGVTTGSMTGYVFDLAGTSLPGATIVAVHTPSGTRYGTATREDGRYNIVGMRVGGPYTLTVSFIGYTTEVVENVYINLGATSDLNFALRDLATQLGEVVVTFSRDAIFGSGRTGASTSVGQDQLNYMPTISRSIGDFTRLTPQASGSSFAGQDNRLNNITVDGSYFNNSFGLGGQPGERTGVAPISLSAIEQISVNIAPYDVRQGNFVGAGVNTVTKSGTNEFKGEVYYNFRNANVVGRQALDLTVDPGQFKFDQFGAAVGGPIIKNRLFFFASFEQEKLTEPGTTFLANTGGQTVGGNITRVLASDLDNLSSFLRTNFNYETGPYQGYDHETPALKFIGKLDFNINDRNKLSVRYNYLDSNTDVLLSNSSSLGFGNRRTNLNALNFQNSNYQIKENIRSIIGELNSRIGDNMANNLIIGYTYQDESRDSRGTMFPLVDILQGGSTYTSFGFEPFTPNNELRYKTFQLQNNLSIFKTNHTLMFGVSAERYESENIFFPGSQSVYIYNSLADFYTDANDYLANPNRTTSPVSLNRFQVRYSNIPGQDKPIQPLKVFYAGIYGQDEWQVNPNLNLTLGLRIDMPFFEDTDYFNPLASSMEFKDEKGKSVHYRTDKMPDPKPLWSPRVGFNWDMNGDRTTQVRGGSGIFTGRPAYVWISNQVGNNGIMTGFDQVSNTLNRPFNPDVNHYKPTEVTGAPASTYELAFTDPDFKFPQIWRNNLAVDQKLPFGFIGTLEAIYSRDVNGVYYINANLVEPTQNFEGADNRVIYPGGNTNRINSNITSAVVLKNQNVGYAYNLTASLERPFTNGLFVKAAYNYGISKNTVNPGSIAFGSWANNPNDGNPNNPGLGYSFNSAGHRVIGALSYRTPSSTTFSMFWESRTIGNFSYVFAGDFNRDGTSNNDLIYIPKDKSEMHFVQFTASGRTFTVAEQEDAWEAFIKQDKYLSKNRGKYAERGAVFLPMVHRADFSISHDIIQNIGASKNTLQFRIDFVNVGNALNKDWGVSKRLVTDRPLVVTGSPIDGEGKPRYRLQNVGNELISKSYDQTAGIGDVFRIQFGVKYKFN